MTILIGYVPTAGGEAALKEGLTQAALTGDDVAILNSPRCGATVDANQIDEEAASELVKRSAVAGVTAWSWAVPRSGSCSRHRCRSWP